MFSHKLKFVYLVVLVLMVASCSKDDKQPEANPKPSVSGPFHALVNDSAFNGLFGQVVRFKNKLYIELLGKDSLSNMNFYLLSNRVGAYDIQNPNRVQSVRFNNYYYNGILHSIPLEFDANYGYINLTKVDSTAGKASGTFEFQATIIPDSWAIVKEGVFNDIPMVSYNYDPVIDSNFVRLTDGTAAFNAQPATFTRSGTVFNISGSDASSASILITAQANFPGTYTIGSSGTNRIRYVNANGVSYGSRSGQFILDVYLQSLGIVSGRFSFTGRNETDTTQTVSITDGRFTGILQ